MMRLIALIVGLGLMLAATKVYAQINNNYLEREDSITLKGHQFRATGLIAPTLLITTGSVMHGNRQLHQLNVDLRDAAQADGHSKLRFDDYMQYAPTVSVYMMKALGVNNRHNYRDLISLTATSYAIGGSIILMTKHWSHILRPDGSNYHSFPSGHTFTAFWGAELMRREFGEEYPGIAIAGYTVATATGLMRIYNNRHWLADVVTGAGVGILGVSVAYWIYPWLSELVWGDKPRHSSIRERKGYSAELTLAPNGIALSF